MNCCVEYYIIKDEGKKKTGEVIRSLERRTGFCVLAKRIPLFARCQPKWLDLDFIIQQRACVSWFNEKKVHGHFTGRQIYEIYESPSFFT